MGLEATAFLKECGCGLHMYCAECDPIGWALFEARREGKSVLMGKCDGLEIEVDKDAVRETFKGVTIGYPSNIITVSDPHGDLLREILAVLRECRAQLAEINDNTDTIIHLRVRGD